MLSSSDSANEIIDARAAGVLAHISKPARQSDLYHCIVSAMRESDRTPVSFGTLENQAKPSRRSEHQQGKILLVEDNRVNQEVTLEMLNILGLKADVADDGRAALETVRRGAYALVLMDCQMPEMDGYEATAAIRREEAGVASSRLPIIALTANAIDGDRERCLVAGMDDYLSKPFSIDQLRGVLQRWLPADQSNDAPRTDSDIIAVSGEKIATPTPIAAGTATTSILKMPVLDAKTLAGIRAMDRGAAGNLLSKLASTYQDTSAALMEELREAVTRRDAERMRKGAHALKSSSANLAALRLSSLCKSLEDTARGQILDGAEPMLALIEAEYARVLAALAGECRDCVNAATI